MRNPPLKGGLIFLKITLDFPCTPNYNIGYTENIERREIIVAEYRQTKIQQS